MDQMLPRPIIRPFLYGFAFGLIKSTIVQFLPFENVINGTISSIVLVILLIVLFFKTKAELNIISIDFVIFLVASLIGAALMTFSFNDHNLITVLTYELKRTPIPIIIGLLISFSRLSNRYFTKLASVLLLILITTLLFAIFYKEKIQELKRIHESKEIEVQE